MDEKGSSVSMTTTVNLLFGSMVYDNGTGFVLNDQMDDSSLPHQSNAFDLTPLVLNFVTPLGRPLSLMSPAIIKKNDRPDLLIGAVGGSRIVTATLQAILRNLFHGMSLDVIAYPRLHRQLIPENVALEIKTLYNEKISCVGNVEAQLNMKNHTFFESGPLTAMNGIKFENGMWHGVSDYCASVERPMATRETNIVQRSKVTKRNRIR